MYCKAERRSVGGAVSVPEVLRVPVAMIFVSFVAKRLLRVQLLCLNSANGWRGDYRTGYVALVAPFFPVGNALMK